MNNFCSSIFTIERIKTSYKLGAYICYTYMDKVDVSKIYKELLQVIKGQIFNRKMSKNLNRKGKPNGQYSYEKMFSLINNQEIACLNKKKTKKQRND